MCWEGDPARSDRPARPDASLSRELRVAIACQSFEAACKAGGSGGTRPRIEVCLAAAEEAERWALLRELLEAELRYPRGERRTLDVYRLQIRRAGPVQT
jgi:hypothetical protein